MIGLLAFVGLTVDAGTLYIGMGHLRRAVDAAALASASQFREGRSYDELEAAARQVVSLNGVVPETLVLSACVDRNDPVPAGFHDPAMCPGPNGLQRKLIRVNATTRVRFSFLALVGWFDTEIQAQAISEAASVDVALAIDTSSSMTQDAQCGDGDDDDADGVADDGCGAPLDANRDDAGANPAVCNALDPTGLDGFPGDCHPFQEVKAAAVNFVERLYYPYDRVAVTTFDIVPTLWVPITNTNTFTQTADVIRNLQVSPTRGPGITVECTYNIDGDPGGCTNTSIGGGLLQAGNEFGRNPVRVESVWVVILLTDGAANASALVGGDINRYCPSTTWVQPFCRDNDGDTRHSVLNTPKANPNNVYDTAQYDSDDYARDMADFVGCAPDVADAAVWCSDTLDYADPVDPEGGQGALVYAVGLGRLVLNFTQGGDIDAGDRTLRYIAAVGDDGDASTDPCAGEPVPVLAGGNDSYSCGNYFFSEFGTGLTAVFESIASRLFTRLTR